MPAVLVGEKNKEEEVDNLISLLVGIVVGLAFFYLGELMIMRRWGRRGMVYSLIGIMMFSFPLAASIYVIRRPWPAVFLFGFGIGGLGWAIPLEKSGRVFNFYERLLGKQEEHYFRKRGE